MAASAPHLPALAPRLRRAKIRHAVVVALLLAGIAGTQGLVDRDRAAVSDEDAVPFSVAAVVVRSFVGQMRGVAADILWLRVNEYVHQRRIMGGDLVRADDEAMMPFVRLITWLNPHFVEAYSLGGQWLAFHFDHPREAAALYEEGIRNNPRDPGLREGAAWVYWKLDKNYAKAVQRASEAAGVAGDDIGRFHALWLKAHILMDEHNIAGAIRAWREVGTIPGYAGTAAHYIAVLSGAAGGPRP